MLLYKFVLDKASVVLNTLESWNDFKKKKKIFLVFFRKKYNNQGTLLKSQVTNAKAAHRIFEPIEMLIERWITE